LETMLLGTWGKILMATRIDGGRAEKWDKLEQMVLEMDKGNYGLERQGENERIYIE
jgi:hypothetical protein